VNMMIEVHLDVEEGEHEAFEQAVKDVADTLTAAGFGNDSAAMESDGHIKTLIFIKQTPHTDLEGEKWMSAVAGEAMAMLIPVNPGDAAEVKASLERISGTEFAVEE
jgi:hypothetical protein